MSAEVKTIHPFPILRLMRPPDETDEDLGPQPLLAEMCVFLARAARAAQELEANEPAELNAFLRSSAEVLRSLRPMLLQQPQRKLGGSGQARSCHRGGSLSLGAHTSLSFVLSFKDMTTADRRALLRWLAAGISIGCAMVRNGLVAE